MVSNHKGLNLPGVAVSVPAMSDKDEADLRWGLKLRADFIALSFVRSAADAEDVRKIMQEEGVMLPVLAKIEKPQAVDNLAEIVRVFDGIMVARGDLGVELPLEQVPLVQKIAVELARRNAKPVIVATQVLESMIENSRPTRAEASDAANAVLDGADALMLSGETSVGKHPIEAVRTMARIIENTEDHGLERIAPLGTKPRTKGGAITLAAATVGEQLDVKYLVTFTQGGDSARRMARLRSKIKHLVFTPGADRALPAVADLGLRDVPDAVRDAHRRDGPPGRHAAAVQRPRPEGRPGGHRRRLAARDPRLHERAAGAPDRRRGGRRGPGLPHLSARCRGQAGLDGHVSGPTCSSRIATDVPRATEMLRADGPAMLYAQQVERPGGQLEDVRRRRW